MENDLPLRWKQQYFSVLWRARVQALCLTAPKSEESNSVSCVCKDAVMDRSGILRLRFAASFFARAVAVIAVLKVETLG